MDAKKKTIAPTETVLRAKAGDIGAIAELWSDCIYLVKHICNKYQPRAAQGNRICDWDDLMQSSYIWFRKCLDKWEPRGNAPFTALLKYYIEEACRLEIGAIVRKSVKMDILPFATSYDITLSDGDNSDTFLELTVDENAEQGFEQVEISDMQKLVRAEVNLLPDMDRQIIRLHYFEGKTIIEIAEILGVVKNTVINRERNAFFRLRKSKILQSLYIEFVSIDIETDKRTDRAAFRLDILSCNNSAAVLRALFDDDALEIFC